MYARLAAETAPARSASRQFSVAVAVMRCDAMLTRNCLFKPSVAERRAWQGERRRRLTHRLPPWAADQLTVDADQLAHYLHISAK